MSDNNPAQNVYNLAQLGAAVEQMKKSVPAIKEYHTIAAELRHNKFVALMAAGFTEKQALELCKGTELL